MRKIGFLLSLSLLLSCSSIDCPLNNTVSAVYTLGGKVSSLGATDTLTIWTIRGDGKDTLLNRYTSVHTFTLPLSYHQPTDVLIMCFTDTLGTQILDTLYVSKTNDPHFESVDCSPSYFHQLTNLQCTHHMLDSVSIAKPAVNYDTNSTHINLYFHSDD